MIYILTRQSDISKFFNSFTWIYSTVIKSFRTDKFAIQLALNTMINILMYNIQAKNLYKSQVYIIHSIKKYIHQPQQTKSFIKIFIALILVLLLYWY